MTSHDDLTFGLFAFERLGGATLAVFDRGGNERGEERMRLVRLGLKFGMRLRAGKPGMIPELHPLDEISPRVHAADDQTRLLELRDVGIVHFVAMPVAFADARNRV